MLAGGGADRVMALGRDGAALLPALNRRHGHAEFVRHGSDATERGNDPVRRRELIAHWRRGILWWLLIGSHVWV